MRRYLVLIAMIIILIGINGSIISKEKHLSSGQIVYLDLAPIDPRSLMQGDYMALRFRIGDEVYRALPKTNAYKRWRHNADGNDGYVVVVRDDKGIASFRRLDNVADPIADNELRLRYRVRNGAVKFATNAFFFEEGQAAVFEPARYGQFRVSDSGELLLAGMYDKDLKKLQAVSPDKPG